MNVFDNLAPFAIQCLTLSTLNSAFSPFWRHSFPSISKTYRSLDRFWNQSKQAGRPARAFCQLFEVVSLTLLK